MSEDEPSIKKVEIFRIENPTPGYQCDRCKCKDAEFETAVWYDDQDPETDEPETGTECGVCIAITFLQETSTDDVILKKHGASVGSSVG
jgi:hypothetical protein